MSRLYSVADLDALRSAVRNKVLWGTYGHPMRGGSSRSYKEADITLQVEEMVRTHMQAGHTVDDLFASDPDGTSVHPASVITIPMTLVSQRFGTVIDGKTYHDHDIDFRGRPRKGAVAWEDEAKTPEPKSDTPNGVYDASKWTGRR